jgi:mannose-6-phosphate isomerase
VVRNVSFLGDLNHKLMTYTKTSYPDTPSYVMKSGKLLQDVLNENKEALMGKTVLAKYGADLPFLPKILSIAKALPLQIHPNKDLATRLHQKDPEKFTDDNHKPEIAVALSKFELFVGFKPLDDLQKLMNLPPLQQFLPEGDHQKLSDETVCHELPGSTQKRTTET